MSEKPKRPLSLDPTNAEIAAGKMADILIRDHGMDDRKGMMEDIIKRARPYHDGYELAKTLDNYCGWSCNLDIAEALDRWSSFASDQLRVMQAAWATENNIQPSLPVGARVTAPRGETGVIDSVYEYSVASYAVKIDGEVGNSRRIIAFEDCAPASDTSP